MPMPERGGQDGGGGARAWGRKIPGITRLEGEGEAAVTRDRASR
jgi:hypothetical protein